MWLSYGWKTLSSYQVHSERVCLTRDPVGVDGSESETCGWSELHWSRDWLHSHDVSYYGKNYV